MVVSKAIAARKLGQIDASLQIFAQYGAMFAASDPTAAPYAELAQSFTRQAGDLGFEGGVYIFQVESGTNAAIAGLRVGDIIVGIGQTVIVTASDFEAAMKALPAGVPFEVKLLRRGSGNTFALQAVQVASPPLGVGVIPI
jgi:S1-C subfamily serine protease